MSNQTNDLELETVENQYWIELAKALVRLESNPDFKAVILDGYFKDRAIDGVSMLASRQVRMENRRPELMEMLNAISQLQDYFITIKNLGTEPDYGVEDEETE